MADTRNVMRRTVWPWPKNISEYGFNPEEINRGRVEIDPRITPLAKLAPTKFLTPPVSSDHLRLGAPKLAEVDDFAGFVHDHLQIRSVLQRGASPIGNTLSSALQNEIPGLQPRNREQMRASLGREAQMVALLKQYNGLQEGIYARIAGGAKA